MIKNFYSPSWSINPLASL